MTSSLDAQNPRSTMPFDANLSVRSERMLESISELNINELLTAITEDTDTIMDHNHRPFDQDESISNVPDHDTDSLFVIRQKPKSMASVYDNFTENCSPHPSTAHALPIVCILGRNHRALAFNKRLLLSGFPRPILFDPHSIGDETDEKKARLSYEAFDRMLASIVLIADDVTIDLRSFSHQNRTPLIIDARQVVSQNHQPLRSLTTIPSSYRAFGNLSNREIEHGTQRVGVAIEQSSPMNLIEFVYDLHSFPRGIYFLDSFSYTNLRMRSLHNCLLPFISAMVIFVLCVILSALEPTDDVDSTRRIYRQASSVTACTGLTLLSLVFLMKPIFECVEWIHSIVSNANPAQGRTPSASRFIQRCLHSRRYLAWYSLFFAFLHVICLTFSNIDLHAKLLPCAFFCGIFALIFLSILSYTYLPWISERLLWNEYHLFTSYLGLICLFLALPHVFLHWAWKARLWNLKFLSMLLPLLVFVLRLIIYGVIHPTSRAIRCLRRRSTNTSSTLATKDSPLLP